MKITDYTSKLDTLIQKLVRLGEDKDELEKWKQVFNSLPETAQKTVVRLLKQQTRRLSQQITTNHIESQNSGKDSIR